MIRCLRFKVPDDPDEVGRQVERWEESGATHVTINTMATGRAGVDGHIAALTEAAEVCGVNR